MILLSSFLYVYIYLDQGEIPVSREAGQVL